MNKVRIIVRHGYRGCDSGCCGHWIDMDGDAMRSKFRFFHTNGVLDLEATRSIVRKLVTAEFGQEHVNDIDWDACEIVSLQECRL